MGRLSKCVILEVVPAAFRPLTSSWHPCTKWKSRILLFASESAKVHQAVFIMRAFRWCCLELLTYFRFARGRDNIPKFTTQMLHEVLVTDQFLRTSICCVHNLGGTVCDFRVESADKGNPGLFLPRLLQQIEKCPRKATSLSSEQQATQLQEGRAALSGVQQPEPRQALKNPPPAN
eukprot:124322-Amphidinium_carterae.1